MEVPEIDHLIRSSAGMTTWEMTSRKEITLIDYLLCLYGEELLIALDVRSIPNRYFDV